jgi:DNA-binding NarL/FixJ family response regulator
MITYFSSLPARSGSAASSGRTEAAEFTELTDREREILDLIAQDHNNTVITLSTSRCAMTVQNYVSSILSKLQVTDRAQAIVRARHAGFVRSQPPVQI